MFSSFATAVHRKLGGHHSVACQGIYNMAIYMSYQKKVDKPYYLYLFPRFPLFEKESKTKKNSQKTCFVSKIDLKIFRVHSKESISNKVTFFYSTPSKIYWVYPKKIWKQWLLNGCLTSGSQGDRTDSISLKV